MRWLDDQSTVLGSCSQSGVSMWWVVSSFCGRQIWQICNYFSIFLFLLLGFSHPFLNVAFLHILPFQSVCRIVILFFRQSSGFRHAIFFKVCQYLFYSLLAPRLLICMSSCHCPVLQYGDPISNLAATGLLSHVSFVLLFFFYSVIRNPVSQTNFQHSPLYCLLEECTICIYISKFMGILQKLRINPSVPKLPNWDSDFLYGCALEYLMFGFQV